MNISYKHKFRVQLCSVNLRVLTESCEVRHCLKAERQFISVFSLFISHIFEVTSCMSSPLLNDSKQYYRGLAQLPFCGFPRLSQSHVEQLP